jgi:hypothetical protein
MERPETSPHQVFYDGLFHCIDEVEHPIQFGKYIKNKPPEGGILRNDLLQSLLGKYRIPIFVVAGNGDQRKVYTIRRLEPTPEDTDPGINVQDIDTTGKGYGFIGRRGPLAHFWKIKDKITQVKAIYTPESEVILPEYEYHKTPTWFRHPKG